MRAVVSRQTLRRLALLAPLPLGGGLLLAVAAAPQAQVVPTDIQQPGTQPHEVSAFEGPDKCDNCHGGYDPQVEPAGYWRGSMMAHASRDPLFWAAMAVAEQDFDGAGDLCLRCHVAAGWIEGRSTPTDGSLMLDADAHGVSCDLCHSLTDPDLSQWLGVQNPPFVANDGGVPPEAYLGSGMYVLWGGSEHLGPLANAAAPHAFLQSDLHRSSDLCGTCHDVSNPAVGDLAPGNGAALPLAPGSYSGVPGAPVDGKAAFNNLPFQYGVVERTFSEHAATLLEQTRVGQYPSLPAELQDGAFERAWQAALLSTPTGDYEDGTPRTFTCQSCHMPPGQGKACNKNNAPVRADVPVHELVGGSTWMPDAIAWLSANNELRLGGQLSSAELARLQEGKQRARELLESAASLRVQGNRVRVVNLTGHKLATGYPEGRRLWLRTRWLDAGGALLREDGAYGPIQALVRGVPTQVWTLLDPHDPRARIYEAHMGISQAWAAELLTLGLPASLPLRYDRQSGATTLTLGELAAQPPGSAEATFHFVLNDTVVSDNRIPPYGMRFDEALARNLRPVPHDQYGDPGPGEVYEHFDSVQLEPPPGAVHADIELLYQSTSWEYVQFLQLANDGANAFLADVGEDLLDAWLATGMAPPVAIATAAWDLAPLRAPGPRTIQKPPKHISK